MDLSSSSAEIASLNADILKSVALNQDFQEALPLLPGVVRGLDGLIRIKGGRTNQTNTLVNTASVTDPFTGQPALMLPAVAVQSVRISRTLSTQSTDALPAGWWMSIREAVPKNGSGSSKIPFPVFAGLTIRRTA